MHLSMCDTTKDSSPQSDGRHEALGVTGNQCTLMSIQQQRLIVPSSSSSLEALGEASVSTLSARINIQPFLLLNSLQEEIWKSEKGITSRV